MKPFGIFHFRRRLSLRPASNTLGLFQHLGPMLDLPNLPSKI